MIIHSHKEIERYEVSSNEAFVIESLIVQLGNDGFYVANQYYKVVDDEIHKFVIFEREKDLLNE